MSDEWYVVRGPLCCSSTNNLGNCRSTPSSDRPPSIHHSLLTTHYSHSHFSIRPLIAQGQNLDAAIRVVDRRGQDALGLVEVRHLEDAIDFAVAAAGAAVRIIDIDMAGGEGFANVGQSAGLILQLDGEHVVHRTLQVEAAERLAGRRLV